MYKGIRYSLKVLLVILLITHTEKNGLHVIKFLLGI